MFKHKPSTFLLLYQCTEVGFKIFLLMDSLAIVDEKLVHPTSVRCIIANNYTSYS